VNDVAYAWMNDWRSVYNDDVCSTVSAQMHEVGHNLNLGHSKHEGDEYGDQSGMVCNFICLMKSILYILMRFFYIIHLDGIFVF
jgi:hypothetical protein